MPGKRRERRTQGSPCKGASPNGQAAATPAHPNDKALRFLHESSVVWGPSLKARVLMTLGDNTDGMTEGDLSKALQDQIPEDCVLEGCNGRRALVRNALHDLAADGRIQRTGKRDEDLVKPAPLPQDTRFEIYPRFRDELPELLPEERAGLEWQLLIEGCRVPLLVWTYQGHTYLIDGHTRLAICLRHGLPYKIEEVAVELPDPDAVVDWMWRENHGRRNFGVDALSYDLGRRFNALKGQHGGDRSGRGAKSQIATLPKAAWALAEEVGVDRATLFRAGRFAAALDRITAVCGPDFRRRLLGRRLKLSRAKVGWLAAREEAEMKRLVAEVLAGKKARRPATRTRRLVLSGSTIAEWVAVLLSKLEPDEIRPFYDILGAQMLKAKG